MYPSWVKISAMSKRTKMSFHLRLITSEYHRIWSKRLLSVWYVWCKSCTYLALTLTLSLNGPKKDLTRPTSPRGSIGCIQKISEPMVWSMQTVHLSCIRIVLYPNGPKGASTWALSPRSTIGCVHNDFWPYGTFGTNHAPILLWPNNISEWTKMRFHMSHIT
jgi:hypothetical protein